MLLQHFTYGLRVGLIIPKGVLLNIIKGYLESSVVLFTFSSIEEAIGAVEAGHIDIILADRTLPDGRSAEALADAMAGIKGAGKVPLIVMTASEDLNWNTASLSPAFVLPKPFTQVLLLEVLYRFARIFYEYSHDKRYILVMDDSSSARKFICNILRGLGDYEFIEADSGKKAIEILDEMHHKIKFVTSDLHMPGMNGIEFTKEARARGFYLPVFIFTAELNNYFVEEAFKAGVNFYFLKNEFSEEHVRFLRQLIGIEEGAFNVGGLGLKGDALTGKVADTILIIEDSATFRQVIASHLSVMGYPVIGVESAEEALALFRLNRILLSIVDLNLPGMSGIEFIKNLQKITTKSHERLVLIYSSSITPLTIFNAFQSGASDYLNAPFNIYDLMIRLYNLIKLRHAFLQIEDASQKYYRLSVTDALTGCYNRRYIHERLEEFIQQAYRYKNDVSVLLIDVNNFKTVNDRLGHEAGDVLLKNIASLCIEQCRETDVFGRIGGDEFLILLPREGIDGAKVMAERIKRAFLESKYADIPVDVSLAIGCASFSEVVEQEEIGKEKILGDNLIHLADERMYEDKTRDKQAGARSKYNNR